MAKHNDTGHNGEQIAREFLLKQGYSIAGVNIRIGNYEIDFIATYESKIIFVEVKTRTGKQADPLEAIDKKKISRLCRAAETYLQTYDIPHEPQFDVITIIMPDNADGEPVIEHFPDAFRPPLSGTHG